MRASFIFLPVSLGLAACATTTTTPSSPPSTARDRVVLDKPLSVCRGTNVSNAPMAALSGEILGYQPFLEVRGIAVARAPVDACLSSAYGPRAGGAGSFHKGIDLYTGAPRPVGAAAGGRVRSLGDEGSYGLVLRLDHGDGVVTLYSHLSATASGLKPGDRVAAGERLGTTGRTGNASAVHLHFEILIDGRPVDPLARPAAGA